MLETASKSAGAPVCSTEVRLGHLRFLSQIPPVLQLPRSSDSAVGSGRTVLAPRRDNRRDSDTFQRQTFQRSASLTEEGLAQSHAVEHVIWDRFGQPARGVAWTQDRIEADRVKVHDLIRVARVSETGVEAIEDSVAERPRSGMGCGTSECRTVEVEGTTLDHSRDALPPGSRLSPWSASAAPMPCQGNG
jgi:hypothetical protein